VCSSDLYVELAPEILMEELSKLQKK